VDQQEMADLLEIQQLAARYMALSARKAQDGWSQVFTPDGVYNAFGTPYGLEDFPMLLNSAPPGQYIGNVPVVEFNRRSIRPHFELGQLFGRHVLQCAYPLSWNQEARIAVRDDLNGIPLGDVANSLRSNFNLCLDSAGGERRSVLGITDSLSVRPHNFTFSVVPS